MTDHLDAFKNRSMQDVGAALPQTEASSEHPVSLRIFAGMYAIKANVEPTFILDPFRRCHGVAWLNVQSHHGYNRDFNSRGMFDSRIAPRNAAVMPSAAGH